MNFGLQDAVNLVWKLAWAKRVIESSSILALPSSPEAKSESQYSSSIKSILKSYDSERRETALNMITWNSLATKRLTSKNPIIQRVRNTVMKLFFGGKQFRRVVSNSLSMIDLQYNSRTSPIIMQEKKKKCGIPGCSNKSILSPGSRLPNFTTCYGEKIYDIVDRSRHSWLILNMERAKNGQQTIERKQNNISEGPGKLPLFDVTVKELQNIGIIVPYCLLIRPDLFIATVGEDINVIWRQLVLSLGDATEFM